MKAIGIRATPKEVFFSIIESYNDTNEIIAIDKVIIPISLSIPDQLNFIRKTIIDIINQFNVTIAGIKLTEGNARRISIERVSIEAIIQELFSSCSIESYYGGNISKISKLLEIPNDGSLKKIINNELETEEFSFLKTISKSEEREACLSALAALNL